MVYYFYVGVILVVVVCFSVLNLFVFYIDLESFYEVFIMCVFFLGLWIFGVSEDGYVIVENSVCYYIEGEKCMLLF